MSFRCQQHDSLDSNNYQMLPLCSLYWRLQCSLQQQGFQRLAEKVYILDTIHRFIYCRYHTLTLVTVANIVCFLLELKRTITSYTAHTPKTVIPCSLLNMLATHITKHSSNHGHRIWFCSYREVFVTALWDLMYAKNDAMKKKHASTSARPTTPVTASGRKHNK